MSSSLNNPGRRTLLAAALGSAFLAACGGRGGSTAVSGAQSAASNAVGAGLVGAYFEYLTSTTRSSGVSGLRRLAPSAEMTGEELMAIGSCGKAMTAMVAARLIERGVLRWDTRIVEALPGLASTMLPAYRAVTLENLLAHRGGILAFDGSDPDHEELLFLDFIAAFPAELPTTETTRRRFSADWLMTQQPPANVTPGQTFSYSNAGFALAAAMLEAATGKTFEKLFDEEMQQPLGIDGVWGLPERVSENQPRGYEGANKAQLAPVPLLAADEQVWADVLRPAGGFSLTPQMYSRWARWHLVALQGGATPLPSGYIARIRALNEDDYAVGWGGGLVVNGRKRIGHTGATGGFIALVEIYLDGSEAAFGLTNTTNTDPDIDWVGDEMLRGLLSMRAYYVG